MSAVWRASRAAVRRRRLQTVIIGVVVLVSTALIVVALGLVAAASGPFDQAYARQSGAHLVATYDSSRTTAAQLAAEAKQPGVTAAVGPFGERVLSGSGPSPTLTVVGRSDPGGPVDRLNVWRGHWAAGLDEIAVAVPVGDGGPPLGSTIEGPGSVRLTVVGWAYSVSKSADGWVSPATMSAIGPTATQMLFRFAHAATTAQVDAAKATISTGLPHGALLGSESYLALKAAASSGPDVYIPFLTTFGVLGLLVAVLIVVNVVSGAVVSGFRHIGVLKSLGFTPSQVMAVYLVMVGIPAVIGTLVGTLLGNALAEPVLSNAFESYGAASLVVAPWVDVVALLGMPLLVLLSAAAPALRARGLSAARAISAGSAQTAGRGLAVQRWLSATRLPRPVSLGLGLPFARPARSGVTLAAVVLGVLSVTLATGLTRSVSAFESARSPAKDRVLVMTGHPDDGPGSKEVLLPGATASTAPPLSDAADQAMLRALPGTQQVLPTVSRDLQIVGERETLSGVFFTQAPGKMAPRLVRGRWPSGSAQVAVNGQALKTRGLRVGDQITLELNGRRAAVQIVGDFMAEGDIEVAGDGQVLNLLDPGSRADGYTIQVAPGTDAAAYSTKVTAGDPALTAFPAPGSNSGGAKLVDAASVLFTLMLGTVAALGVFNTVVLNTRERRRELGMLKSIGMTPRQLIAMLLTSMGVIGVLGGVVGVPLGIGVHRLVVPAMVHSGQVEVPDFLLNVFDGQLVVGLGLAAIAIAVLGAIIPARSAAWSPIAEVLRSE